MIYFTKKIYIYHIQKDIEASISLGIRSVVPYSFFPSQNPNPDPRTTTQPPLRQPTFPPHITVPMDELIKITDGMGSIDLASYPASTWPQPCSLWIHHPCYEFNDCNTTRSLVLVNDLVVLIKILSTLPAMAGLWMECTFNHWVACLPEE